MPRPKSPPRYEFHKSTGQAYTRIGGKCIYLGKHGSAESHAKFSCLLSQWELTGEPTEKSLVTVSQLLLAYLKHAHQYYRKDGRLTSEYACLLCAGRALNKHFGKTSPQEFGPRSLLALREKMIDQGLARKTVNDHVNRVRRMFRWATECEMVRGDVYHALLAVRPLKPGRTRAKDFEPRRPVSARVFIKTRREVRSKMVRDMMVLQRYTGMRSGELIIMRPSDIDRTGDVWIYTPMTHKTEHYGKKRVIPLGPKSQRLLLPYLVRGAEMWCFPAAKNPAKHARRDTYRNTITRAAKRAGVEPWCPHRLRHTAATAARREGGLEAAQQMLGHATAKITEVYAERNLGVAMDIARKIG